MSANLLTRCNRPISGPESGGGDGRRLSPSAAAEFPNVPGAGSSKAAGLSKSFNVLSPYGLARTCVAVGPSGGVRTHAPGAIVGGSWAHYYFLSTLHCPRLTHEAMLIDPKAELGETMLPVMLSPPLPANENPPLATTGGASSVRLEAPTPS